MSTYAISDIHGNLAIAQQVVDIANQGNTVYFLGDACDRGKHGWEIIKMFLRTDNIVYLMGNHEDMLIKAMRPYFHRHSDDYQFTRAFEIWSWNGCQSTLEGILEDDFEKASMYYSQLHTLRMFADYTNNSGDKIYMCHSGWEYFLRDDYHDLRYNEKILWDRNHYWELEWIGYDNEYMIHGHTPCPYLAEEIGALEDPDWKVEDGPYQYCEGHKVDMDALTIKTHCAFLLDLDTYECRILEGEE